MRHLYEWPPTRSQRVRWALEELGLDYSSHEVDFASGAQDAPAYRDIHPLGIVPALQTDSYTIFESVAILLQLIDESADKGLAPAVGSADRARYYQWCVFACAELDPAIIVYFDNTMRPLDHMRPPGAPHDPMAAERGRYMFEERARVVSAALEDRRYLLGSTFSGADIAVGHSCFMAIHTGLIDAFPILKDYHQRLRERPAYQKAYGAFAEPAG